ncbi:MAG: class D sortase [Christensenellales bacterium]|jgi:sortase A
MKSKILLIAVVALIIAASICLMIWQRQNNGQLIMENGQLRASAAPVAPDTTQSLDISLATPAIVPEEPSIAPSGNSDNRPKPTGPAFSVYINGKTIPVSHGVDEKTLSKGPGWMETSALPGQDGMCIIYGHRNRTHLRILETVEAGDSITATLPDGSQYTYIVTQVQAVEDSVDLEIPTLDGKSIALITCYPFRYSGSAPGKYLVIGQLNADVAE